MRFKRGPKHRFAGFFFKKLIRHDCVHAVATDEAQGDAIKNILLKNSFFRLFFFAHLKTKKDIHTSESDHLLEKKPRDEKKIKK
jgi:hypothetical protein